MRDPFFKPSDVENQLLTELQHRSPEISSGSGYMFESGDAKPSSHTSDSLLRRHLQHVSGPASVDKFQPEVMELLYISRSQEEEIHQLRKQVTNAFMKEIQLLGEKHILERQLCELRMALDEKQGDAISSTLRELTRKRSLLEENIKKANDLKDAEEELYMFTSSLLTVLAEYDIRPSVISASTIANAIKRLHQQMQLKARSYANFDEPPSSSKNRAFQTYQDTGVVNLHANASNPSRDSQDYEITPRNKGAVNSGDAKPSADSQYYTPVMHDNQSSSISEDQSPLPGIEGFQIFGDALPGCTLQAAGFPMNGTTLCIFQWVRELENGTRQYIEGATVPSYVVTADDVDTILAVDCTPMDDLGRQGELVRQFANNQSKITCDPDMQQQIDTYLSTGKAIFNVLLLNDSSEEWEPTILVLKRLAYQIKDKRTEQVLTEEKYSPDLYIKVPFGHSNQFVLVCSDGTNLPFSTSGTSKPSTENDIRLRDTIVLTMRYFQSKVVDSKKKGKI